jgi:hypothetical protein
LRKALANKTGKIFKWISFLGLTILLLAWLLVWLFEDKIKALAIESINANVNTEIKVSSIEMSVWKHFPDVSLVFNQVSMSNAQPYKAPGKLLEADQIALSFSIWNLFGNDYTVKKAFVKNGAINLLRDKDQNVNYIFWKQDSISTGNKLKLEFELLQFEKVNFRYLDVPSQTEAISFINKLKLKGRFSDEIFDVQADVDTKLSRLEVDYKDYGKDKQLLANLFLKINTQTSSIEIAPSELKLEALKLNIAGNWDYAGEGNMLDLKLEGKDMDIRALLSLIPELSKQLDEYDSDGDFFFSAEIKGRLSENNNPAVVASFGVNNGSIRNKKRKLNIRNLQLNGSYNNGKKQSLKSSIIDISTFDFQTATGRSKGRFRLENPDQPIIDLKADLNLMISEVYSFFENDRIVAPEGKCIGQVIIKGDFNNLKKINQQGFRSIIASGSLQLSNCSFSLKDSDIRYEQFSGSVNFDNNDIIVNNLSGSVSGTFMSINGRLGNVFSYLAGSQQQLSIDANLEARDVDLDNFISKETKLGKEQYALDFPEQILVNIKAQVDVFRFRNFTAKEINGQIKLRNGVLETQQLRFRTMDGSVDAIGFLKQNSTGDFTLDCRAKFSKVDIRTLFYAFDNFGQNTLIDANIKGVLNADLLFKAQMKANLTIDEKNVYALADIQISNGELINFEPLNALSRFISLDELKWIRFSALKNTIEIKQGKIHIPKMDINSSALNLTLSGTHSFENDMDYQISLFLNELLAKKAKRNKIENTEFGEELDDGSGRTRLFISMKGKVDNPVFQYDRKGAKESRKEQRKESNQQIKNLLKEEFGNKDKKSNPKQGENTHPDRIEIDF